MSSVKLIFPDDTSVKLDCRELHGTETLGQASTFMLVAVSPDPIAFAQVVNKGCVIQMETAYGGRAFRGTVTRFTAVATSDATGLRTFRLEVRSSGAILALSRRSRVHQHLSVPDVIKATLKMAGWPDDRVKVDVKGTHDKREYLVQYDETDEAFIRRICEDDGLYFRYELGESGDVFVLQDTSTAIKPTLPFPITLIDDTNLHEGSLAAWDVTFATRRGAGKVTLRDYDRKKPSVKLEGTAEAGTDLEKATEVYLAPGRFKTGAEGTARATLELEARRAETQTITLRTNALSIAPGEAVTLEPGSDFKGPPYPDGDFFVVSLSHSWEYKSQNRYELGVRLIPSAVPFRLPKVTPTPKIAGIHSALVTGAGGEEIHPDKDGCIFVRFYWDREGPTDDKSSLPVRVSQPNMPGSMNIPRIGWEVFVTFEDGDPDRPYVIGRTYNAKTVPPINLPANKTMTSISTLSSPGGAAKNAITFEDKAGGQLITWHAGFGKNVTVSNDYNIRTGNVEAEVVKASQTRTVSGKEDVSVNQAHLVEVGSQTASVSAKQDCYITGNATVKVGSETVVVGAALLEKIGNPVQGAINLAVQAGIAGIGALGERLGGVAGLAAPFVGAAAGIGYGMYQAATAPGAGPHAARDAGIRGLMGAAAGFVPGGDAVFASVGSMGVRFPWEPEPPAAGAAAAGGGAGAAVADNAAAQGPGPGHRVTTVKGAMLEAIAGSNVVVTPGAIKWTTLGAALIKVGASYSTKAVAVSVKTLGMSSETLGSFHITSAAEAGREVKGPVKTTISGALKSHAGGQHSIDGGSSMTLKVGGGLNLDGASVVFGVGGTFLVSSPGGVLIKAATIKIKDKTKQSGKASHQ